MVNKDLHKSSPLTSCIWLLSEIAQRSSAAINDHRFFISCETKDGTKTKTSVKELNSGCFDSVENVYFESLNDLPV